MKRSTLISIFIFLTVFNSFSQSNCAEIMEGVVFYNTNEFKAAIKSLKAVKNTSTIGDDCYTESCLWIAKSYFEKYSSQHSPAISYLSKAISYSNIEALRFYAFEYTLYNDFITQSINMGEYLDKYEDGEIYFLIGNIYAKKRFFDQDVLFDSYFHNALRNGFNPKTYPKNEYIKVNRIRYNEYIDRFIDPFESKVTSFVELNINNWQKKDKFEKTATYRKRVNEKTRELEIIELTQYYIDSIGSIKMDFYNSTNEYDADNEIFKITFNNLKSIYIKVPISEARSFDQNFKKINYEEANFTYFERNFEILHLEVINPSNSLRYIYDSKELVAFNSSTLSLNFDEVDIELNGNSVNNNVIESSSDIYIGKSDVDTNIPINKEKSSNKYALVIGNEDYTKYQSGLSIESNVDFAKADAITFSKYCINTLGVPEENIVIITDAISSQMRREIEKLMKIAQYSNGNAELIFYYAGHGLPDEQSKESYLIPVDIGGYEVTSGIKLADVYSKLSKYPSQKVTIFLDACFSGGARNQGLLASRGVKIQPKEEYLSGKIVVFAASTGIQSSLPYKQKQHGMFTYFLLKKLQESNGKVTYGDLSDYIINQVQLNSIKVNSKDQNPQILYSGEIEEIWEKWTF